VPVKSQQFYGERLRVVEPVEGLRGEDGVD
jgi:hypothetical protein